MRLTWFLAAYLFCTPVLAGSLQVTPVTLTLAPSQQADGIWLSNTGAAPLEAQVRVFRWTQHQGEERLEPTRELIISPPMLQIPAQERQLVRVIRSGALLAGREEVAYRIWIDELPVSPATPTGAPSAPVSAGTGPAGGGRGLNFVMRHSLPIFLLPAGEPPSGPQLKWSIKRQADKALLEVSNTGGVHAQLAELVLTDAAGRVTPVHSGLLGYVLPGVTMRWELKIPLAQLTGAGRWQAMINGITAEQDVAPLETTN